MNNNELNKKLKELKIEDFIWIIYIGIIFLSWYSNSLERNFFLTKDNYSKEKYRKILITIFSILLVVYIYFLKSSWDDLKSLKNTDTKKRKELVYLSFTASLLIAISGVIFLYTAIIDQNIEVELAFN